MNHIRMLRKRLENLCSLEGVQVRHREGASIYSVLQYAPPGPNSYINMLEVKVTDGYPEWSRTIEKLKA